MSDAPGDAARDLELLRAWRTGDEKAGSELVSRHSAALYRFFRSRVQGPELTDLCQRTFLASVETRDRVPEGVSFRAYLLGIARNKLLHFLRKGQREKRALDAAEHGPMESIRTASRIVTSHEDQKLLVRAIRNLPLDLQMTVELFYWEDLKITEVATILDVSPGTVKSRLFRAKASLRELIADLAESDEVRQTTQDDLEAWAASLREVVEADVDARED